MDSDALRNLANPAWIYALDRKDLQRTAKDLHVKANGKVCSTLTPKNSA